MSALSKIVLVWICLSACGNRKDVEPTPANESRNDDSSEAVSWARVGERLPYIFSARAVLASESSAEVAVPIAGQVRAVRVNAGDYVTRGSVLFVIHSAELAGAAAMETSARRQVDALSGRLAHLRTLQTQGLARAADIAALEVELAGAVRDQQSARAVLRSAPRARGRHNEPGLAIVSPIDGVVVDVRVRLGAFLEPNQGPVVVISQNRAERLEAVLPFAIADDTPVTAVASDGTRLALRTLRSAPNSADGQSGASFRTWFVGDDLTFVLGHLYRVELALGNDVICIPENALLFRANGVYFWGQNANQSPIEISADVQFQSGTTVCLRPAQLSSTFARNPDALESNGD